MATLVTGGTGFIASNLVKLLAERGHDVVCFDIAPPDDLLKRYVAPVAHKITWVRGDITDKAAVEQVAAAHRIDKVVHAAVYTATGEELERSQSRRIVDINLVGSINLLDMAVASKVKRFVYVSSGGVYGMGDYSGDRLLEWDRVEPNRLYSITKHSSELLTERYGDLHGFSSASIRIGGPYGNMERPTGHRSLMSQVYQWTGSYVRGEAIQVHPRATGSDFTYVLDLVGAMAAVLDALKLEHRLYNAAAGVFVPIDEYIATFRKAFPDVKIVEARDRVRDLPQRPPIDITRLREDTGFAPKYDLLAGLRAYVAWRREFGYTA